jgi:hypothetical protein
VAYSPDDYYIYSGFVNNVFSSYHNIGYNVGAYHLYPSVSSFTLNLDSSHNFYPPWDFCGVSNYKEIKCIDINGTLDFTINTNRNLIGDFNEILVSDINNNGLPDLLFSDGSVEEIPLNNFSSYSISDWESTFTSSDDGNILLSDLSDDESPELIYFDDVNLYIYSVDHTPINFMNYTYESNNTSGNGTTTTTTSTTTSTTTTTISQNSSYCYDSDGNNIMSIGLINTDLGRYDDICVNGNVREHICEGNIGSYY